MEYFASLPADRLAAELQSRIDSYYNWILTTGRLARWRIAYDTYYGSRGLHNSSYVTPAGKQGEFSFLMSNEYRNLVQHLLVMAFQSKRSFETVAINTDSKAKSQSYLAKGINEYYRRDGRIAANEHDATEIALIMDVGWVFNEWDILLGTEVAGDPETGQLVRQGEIRSRARTPLDVVTDFTKPQGTDRDWIMVRDPVNKFDLAAQYTDQAEEITGLGRDYTRDALFRFGDIYQYESGLVSPDIDRWTFFHRRSPSMPQGRMFQFLTANIFTFDGPTPYRKLPGNRVCPTEKILSALGYSNTNDLLALQDCLDALISAGVTNMTACGMNNIWTEDTDYTFEQLAQGLNMIKGAKKPEALILNHLSPELLPLANFIIARMEALSGMNAVARGNLDGKDLSGAAMALLQSMAIQFNNGLMQSVSQLATDDSNDVIQLTQDFAQEERLGMIVGRNNKYMMKRYSSKDLKGIEYVYARERNPLQDTTAGKMQLLETYRSIPGVITDAAQITEIIETGQLDSTTEGPRNLLLAIDEENEAIMDGQTPPVIFSDMHPEHLKRHARVFASPEARSDPGLVERMRIHCDEHSTVWQQTDPALLMALGIPPFPGPLPGLAPPGGPSAGPGGPGGPPPPGGPRPPPPPSKPPVQGPQSDGKDLPGAPHMPVNPLTKQRWNPQTGGLPPGAGE
jgi:hypothetical protein